MIWESQLEKLLGMLVDKDLNFDSNLKSLCKKVNQKVSALARIANILPFQKRHIIMKTFIESQFSYCPLVWMFCSRSMNNKINHIHERALRIVYQDYSTTFEGLLKKDNSLTFHHRNWHDIESVFRNLDLWWVLDCSGYVTSGYFNQCIVLFRYVPLWFRKALHKRFRSSPQWQNTDWFLVGQSCVPLERTFYAKIRWYSEKLSESRPLMWNIRKSRKTDISHFDPKCAKTISEEQKMSKLTSKVVLQA